jgi:hypothetical protein
MGVFFAKGNDERVMVAMNNKFLGFGTLIFSELESLNYWYCWNGFRNWDFFNWTHFPEWQTEKSQYVNVS